MQPTEPTPERTEHSPEPAAFTEPAEPTEPTTDVLSEPAPWAPFVPPVPFVPAFGEGGPPQPTADRRSSSRQTQNRLAGIATIALAIVLAFGAGVGVGRVTAPAGSGASPAPSGLAASPGAETAWYAGLPSDGALLGRADAKVRISYWADFQCPFCSKFAVTILPQLATRIADGTVAVEHKDYAFIGAESLDAAIAVRCAGEQSLYWPMHDAVYAAQAGENQGAFAPEKLAAIAASVGLNSSAFATCIARDDMFIAVLADTSAGVHSGVRSTPTVDVAGQRLVGITDIPAFLASLDASAAAAAAGTTPAPIPAPSPSGDPWTGTVTAAREAGSQTAPVTVQLWTDYQLTDMAAVASNLEPELRTRIAAGKVRLELHDLALNGAESVAAATMVRCTANQNGPAWLVHDVLSVSAQGPGMGIYVTHNLLRLGARLGLDIIALNTCLSDAAIAAQVTAETSQGQAIQLTKAPAVIIRSGNKEVGRFSGALDVAKVLAAIDAVK